MARITLIEMTCPDIRAFGVRCIAAALKAAGHDCNLMFLPPETELVRFKSGEVFYYTEEVLQQVADLCADSDFVGLSFMTYYYDRALQLTNALQQSIAAPIIWGGIHATVKPIDCLQKVPMVCLGEGEDACVELCNRFDRGEDITKTPNFWFNVEGKIVKNDKLPLVSDLNRLPFPDIDISTHYCYDPESNLVRKMDVELQKHFMTQGPLSPLGEMYHYKTMASRGCPHNCNYCSVSVYREMYEDEKYLRWRQIQNVMDELKHVVDTFPFVNGICFFDDSMLSCTKKYLKEFSYEYKRQIGLPMAIQTSPPSTKLERLKPLVEAGARYVEMGIQSGSEKVNEEYNRRMTNKQVVNAANAIHHFKEKLLPPDFHLMLDNPWMTEEDELATIRLGLKLPKPFGFKPSSLVLYPGTGINRRAMQDGLIDDEVNQVYRKAFGAPAPTYLNFIVFLIDLQMFPNAVLEFMTRPDLVKVLNRPAFAPAIVASIMGLSIVSMASRGITAAAEGDFARIGRFIKRRLSPKKSHAIAMPMQTAS